MKRILVLLAILALFGCNKTDEPDKVVEKFFTELQQGNFKEASAYVDAPVFDTMPEAENKLLSSYFVTLTFSKPVIIEQDDSRALVAVDLEAVQLFEVIQAFIMELTAKVEENPDLDVEAMTEELDAQVLAMIKSPEAPRAALTLEIELFKLGGGNKQWTISSNETLQAGIFLQTPMSEPEYDVEVPEADYESAGVTEASGKYMGGDELAGLCSFIIDGEPRHMYCAPIQYSDLEINYKEQDVKITFQILASPEQEAAGDISGRIYILESYSK